MPPIPDPHSYLARFGFATVPDHASVAPSVQLLQALHQAHMLAVPFENLSIHYGQPIILRDTALYSKIVGRHRGGFCYELNGLFAWLLGQLGFKVTLLSAGVAEAGQSFSPEYDHLTLLVHDLDGADWLADVGFGDSFRRPLRFQADVEQDGGDGRIYRLHASQMDDAGEARDYWLVQRSKDSRWEPQYRFTVQPHVLADFEERCVFQQTSPESHFTRRRICSLALPNGRITLSDMRLIKTLDGTREERDVGSEDEYRAILASDFGISLE